LRQRGTYQHTVNAKKNYVPKYFRDYADSEYVSYVGVDRKGAEFTGNKYT